MAAAAAVGLDGSVVEMGVVGKSSRGTRRQGQGTAGSRVDGPST